MRILLCTSEFGNKAGGLAFHCMQLKAIFEQLGHSVYVEILPESVDYNVVEGGYDPDLGNKIRLAYKLKTMNESYADKTDLCISCGAGITAYKAMLFCKKNCIPLGVVLCGSEVNLAFAKSELAYYNAKAFEYASAIIGISEELNENAKLFVDTSNSKYYVIPIMCELGDNIVEDKKDKSSQLIFATGAAFLGEKKGISNLILAFAKLIKEKQRNDILYLFGEIDGDVKKQYIDMVKTHSIENNVVFWGYLPRKEFISKMSNVDIYIQASPFEGFGISVAEALQAGKEILISNSGFIAEAIRHDFSGHIIKSLKPEKLAEQIYDFIENTISKNENGRIRAALKEVLSESVVIPKWDEVLRNISVGERLREDICTTVMFHDVDCAYTGVDYAIDGFEKLLKIVYKKNYKLCSVREYFHAEDREKLIICTFDDGYENVYKNALPCMQKYGFTATVFVCPDLIGKNNKWNHRDDVNRRHLTHEMILELVKAGWEIGSHGLSHMNMLRLSEHELDYSLLESKRRLQAYGSIDSFCYPYGIFNLYVKDKVTRYYKNAFSVTVGGRNYVDDPFQITRLTPEDLLKLIQ